MAEESVARRRAFASASSHSNRVRVAKFALPAIALAGLIGAVGYMWLSRVVPSVDVDLSGSAIKDGRLIMANPKLDGFTSGNLPYAVRAARAIQDLGGSGAIDLEQITATVPLSADNTARIVAPSGIFDSDANMLDLDHAFTVETTDGMRAELGSAEVDIGNGNLSTDEPVRISTPGSKLEADSMKIEDNGKRVLFQSGVRLVIEPETLKKSASAEDSPAN